MPAPPLVMDDPLALAMLSAACAVAEGALPEREPHPRVFHGLVQLVARLPRGAVMLADLIRWETVLLADLGYGLDLTRLRGHRRNRRPGLRLAAHRPRGHRGRRRHLDASGCCACRGFLAGGTHRRTPADWRDGLRADRPFPGARRVRPPAPPAARRRGRCYTTASPRWRTN